LEYNEQIIRQTKTLAEYKKLIIDGTQLTNEQDIANALNKHFSNVKNSVSNGDKLDNMKQNNPFANSNTEQGRETLVPSLVFKLFSTKEMTQIIKSLKTKNSSGYDEINTKLLKISVNYISSPLTYICNKSISAGIFPERLKFSIIKPLFKKGDRTIPSNYRPISLLTAFSKVMEKALYNRLIDHLNTNNLIHPQQFGFRQNLSTENAIFNLTHDVSKALNNKLSVGSIFFDLEKSFDSVAHSTLISKLLHFGIIGKSKILIESYLTNRFQKVQLACPPSNIKSESTWMRVKRGVPQGSILGPLLFILHINDLPNSIMQNATPIIFADDTSILIARHDANKLQEDLTQIYIQVLEWFKQNSLSLNINKTFFTQFFTKGIICPDTTITYGNECITRVNDLKFLGLNINNTLNWKSHIEIN
jgi:hypothetical protein